MGVCKCYPYIAIEDVGVGSNERFSACHAAHNVHLVNKIGCNFSILIGRLAIPLI